MRSTEEQKQLFEYWKQNKSKNSTSIVLNIPRKTVVDWFVKFDNGYNPYQDNSTLISNLIQNNTTNNHFESLIEKQKFEKAYAYVLGLYLGDGHISLMKNERSYRLRIFQDAKYLDLIEECKINLSNIFPNNTVSTITRLWKNKPSCTIIYVFSTQLPQYFPQHGPGKKHDRDLILEPWQEKILFKYPKQFIKGLIHSDGCRYRMEPTKEKFGYTFSNKSDQLHEMFQSYSWLFGIDCKKTNKVITSICRKEYVAKLDEFVGPKS